MALNFERIKIVDKKIKHLINGYIRECQQLFPINIIYYNIPSLINVICILFYFTDEWDLINGIGDNMILNKNVVTSTSIYYDLNSAFMKNICEYGKFYWKFKIKYGKNKGKGWTCVIGIWRINSNNNPPKNDCFTNGSNNGYGFGYEYEDQEFE